ncbi:conserved hypothetical protein [Cupriavidus taiwanensis]|uniref:Helix-turn-helix domain-containing protein n=2 Tax=Cupriavidus TaxID=106589 RepID=A0A375CM42_9BURK|nr:conserved hypothetical protein [Cupriavidus taiwanensis]SOZ40445.1 conserved hypothetical protein [Cupriavidus neocaledonicus]SOY74551.1 conserved hypothetical protein [Cupriavidus taiwanensis]SOY74558.1 conserved hypothetical protein [Cupriavidus taiwanensis]SOY75448.1 conserved hypothetical protein [Cupriavidus taiwanensis]
MRARIHLRARSTAAESEVEINLATWPTVDEQALPEPQRVTFLARVSAVRLYLNGADGKHIREKAGISRGQVYRLLTERCLAPHPDGRIYGWPRANRPEQLSWDYGSPFSAIARSARMHHGRPQLQLQVQAETTSGV